MEVPFRLWVLLLYEAAINCKPHYTTHITIRSSWPRNGKMGLLPAIVTEGTSNKSPVSKEEQGLNIAHYFQPCKQNYELVFRREKSKT